MFPAYAMSVSLYLHIKRFFTAITVSFESTEGSSFFWGSFHKKSFVKRLFTVRTNGDVSKDGIHIFNDAFKLYAFWTTKKYQGRTKRHAL